MKRIILSLLILVGCGKKDDHGFNGTMYTYGSSITYGLARPNYAQDVATALNYNIIENAKGGSSLLDKNSAGDSDQYDLIMAAQWPAGAMIVWDTGINDGILHAHDPVYLAKFTQGIQDVMTKLNSSNVTVYVLTPNHTCDEPRFGLNSDFDLYGTIVKNAVKALNNPKIKIIDMSVGFTPTVDNSLEYYDRFSTTTGTTLDCAHPNLYGYRLMADYLMKNM